MSGCVLSAEELERVALALRRAGVTRDAACAGFLWAVKDTRRAWRLLADLKRAHERLPGSSAVSTSLDDG